MSILFNRVGMVLVLVAVIGLAWAAIPTPVAACSYSLPGWYRATATLHLPPLPLGVTIEEYSEEVSYGTINIVQINNTTTIPLYVIGNFVTGETTFEAIGHTFSDRRGPTQKVVDGVVWTWDPPRDTGERTWTWQPTESAVDLIIGDSAIGTHGGYAASYRHGNSIGDNRPATVPIPLPEQVEIALVYGTDLLIISVDITYSLNSDYDPHAEARVLASCNRDYEPASELNLVHLLLIGGFICILLAGLIIRRHRRDEL